jgi:hypothetical protein
MQLKSSMSVAILKSKLYIFYTKKLISNFDVDCPTVCLHFELLYFLKYDVWSEYLTPFWFAMLLSEYEIEFMFRKIRNIRNLGNIHIRGPHIVMSRTDVQNGL